jgi:hypothetical protein
MDANKTRENENMGIKVYHGKDFRAMNNARLDVPALNFPKDFYHVATVDVADDDMHLVFEATNSIDRGWWENANVTAHTDSPAFREHNGVKGTRSTSVGDRIVLSDGRVFKCADIGWEEDMTASTSGMTRPKPYYVAHLLHRDEEIVTSTGTSVYSHSYYRNIDRGEKFTKEEITLTFNKLYSSQGYYVTRVETRWFDAALTA